ncbi:cytochrome P450 [Vararia minispora EC-137]|uniref:Cytochrome P450 n=1 Tax=Vararia minispora EC-137 TaxID=1314806 RepID=A0ACB8QWJ0_9AGAM|nr:cytochrome P450 [Vararia minispora EC-137]
MALDLLGTALGRLFAFSALIVVGGALVVLYRLSLPDTLPELHSPLGADWIGGHLSYVSHPAHSPPLHKRWVEQYGRNMRIQGVHPWDQRLLSLDPVSIHHIMKNAHGIYEKPPSLRAQVGKFIGFSLLATEGALHRRQRRVANPAFSVPNLRGLVPLVFGLSEQIRDRWLTMEAESAAEQTDGKSGLVLDIVNWMARATFDVIGLAGFDYHFDAIQHETDELFIAYREMFEIGVAQEQKTRSIWGVVFPFIIRIFPDTYNIVLNRSHEIINRVARQLISEKKARIAEADARGELYAARDLLTLLLRSNASIDIPPEQRISDDDIMHTINTFLFAGMDTTSLALTWAIVLLAKHQDLQKRLRGELFEVERPADMSDELAQDFWKALNNLPFLDHVCRETLRLMAPVHTLLRAAMADDVIPTMKPFVGSDGKTHEHFTIREGTIVHIPVEGINLDKKFWGEDAWKFNPDRWSCLPESVASLSGIYANTLTFSAGPRSCIGQRFSIIEMKLFLYTLMRAFTFDEDQEARVVKANVGLIRPYVIGRRKDGSRCPLVVRSYAGAEE